jgi:hypothetical protein
VIYKSREVVGSEAKVFWIVFAAFTLPHLIVAVIRNR